MSFPFKALVDWNRSGSFAGSDEDVTLRIRVAAGLSWQRGKDQIQERAPSAAGEATFVLANQSRDYSPGNTSSPLYPNVLPGCLVRVKSGSLPNGVLFLQDGSNLDLQNGSDLQLQDTPGRNLWTGILDDIAQFPERSNLSVGMRCLGTLSRLIGKTVSTPLYENITIDQAIGYVLDAAGWPSIERALQPSPVVLRYFWAANQDAFQLIESLRITEALWSGIYEDPDGNIVFENADARTTQTRSTVSQATFTQSDMVSISYSPNFRDVIQGCVIQVDEREPQALDVIWSYGRTLVLSAGEVKKLRISTSDPFINAVIPSPVGVNAEQLLLPSAPLTDGTYIANVNGVDTSAIAYNASTSTIQSAFDAAVGAGNTVCAGTLATGLRVQFVGDLAGKDIPLITITSSLNVGSASATVNVIYDGDGTNGKYKIFPSAPLISGTFKLRSINGNTTTSIDFDESDTVIQTRLVALPLIGPGDVTVSGGDIDTDTLTVEFVGALAGQVVALSVVQSALMTSTASTATINVTQTIKGGGPDYMISAGGLDLIEFENVNAASMTVKLTANGSGATVEGLQVRAQPVTVARSHEFSYPEDLTAIESNNGQVATPDIWPIIPLDYAETYPQNVVLRYENPLAAISIRIAKAVDDPTNDALFQREISDMLTVVNAQIGLNDPVHVESMSFSIVGGTLLVAEFGCEIAYIPPPMFRV